MLERSASGDSDRQAAERLHPSRSSDRYVVLSRLRDAVGAAAARHLTRGAGLTLVDHGCGTMPYRPLFEPYLGRYLGADLASNPRAALTCEPGGRVPLPDGAAEVVLSTQVLEHVADPEAYLLECRRLLRAGGVLLLSTHGTWPYHPDPVDYWRWTSEGLRRQIEEAGFAIAESRGILGLAATSVQLFQDAVMPALPRFLRPLLAAGFQLAVDLVDRGYSAERRDRDACVYVVVAHRRD
jgi:SAM-dependent methyltransferase